MKSQYVIKSGDGYLLTFKNEMPLLTTDPMEATRFEKRTARQLATQMEQLGWEAQTIKAIVARKVN